MMTFRSAALLALSLLSPPALLAAQPIDVPVHGAVNEAGVVQVQAGGRIADVLNVVRPRADAYLLGATLLREKARHDQVRLRAGLLHTLGQLPQHENPEVRASGLQLQAWLEAHEATGRVPIVLDRRLMQAQPFNNPLVESGDSLALPLRPSTIRVLGAVAEPCELAHQPLQDAVRYLRLCPTTAAADPNLLYVVQPDGAVQRLGVAAWNRADPQPVAAGGTIYVPIRESALKHLDTTFNEDLASFIATQPVDH